MSGLLLFFVDFQDFIVRRVASLPLRCLALQGKYIVYALFKSVFLEFHRSLCYICPTASHAQLAPVNPWQILQRLQIPPRLRRLSLSLLWCDSEIIFISYLHVNVVLIPFLISFHCTGRSGVGCDWWFFRVSLLPKAGDTGLH